MAYERYVIVCDESTRHGKSYSYFYGGAIIKESNYQKINNILSMYSCSKNLGEIKRTKIDLYNYKNYIEVLELFFTFIKSSDIKARVMFAKNDELDIIPKSQDETYCKFYYLFLRYAFSLYYAKKDISLRVVVDDLPETKDACIKFKTYLVNNLNNIKLADCNRVSLIEKDIEEVDSKKHLILQCMDVIMGLVDFSLNSTEQDFSSNRGKAKLLVWNFIKEQILEIHPDFIFDTTTQPLYSIKGWKDVYKHFTYKKGKNKTPVIPT